MDFIDLAISEINRYNHPYQIISRTVKYQSFVITIIRVGRKILRNRLNKPIRGAIFNYNNLVSDLDIETCTPDSGACKDSKYVYPAA